ncbi:hypothetical protein [Pontibacter sp. SGAir0037]|uniref:hypothetical protein n=1 Tax=Pontibacter sp. SGAir0037 TaxID=2571030 RepID=UPI001F10BC47|nr:hypothetical protein [Pontibacter sp. SGAir0037]
MAESTRVKVVYKLSVLKGKWYSLALCLLLWTIAAGCRQQQFPEVVDDVVVEQAEAEVVRGQILAQVSSEGEIRYVVPKQEFMQPFIKEFGDGTVVDKTMIRKVQESDDVEPIYYLVGLGIRNGAFRSMALELELGADNSLYLSSASVKHMCSASLDCDFCYFTFSGNKIIGCECSKRNAGSECRYNVEERNTLLDEMKISSPR